MGSCLFICLRQGDNREGLIDLSRSALSLSSSHLLLFFESNWKTPGKKAYLFTNNRCRSTGNSFTCVFKKEKRKSVACAHSTGYFVQDAHVLTKYRTSKYGRWKLTGNNNIDLFILMYDEDFFTICINIKFLFFYFE